MPVCCLEQQKGEGRENTHVLNKSILLQDDAHLELLPADGVVRVSSLEELEDVLILPVLLPVGGLQPRPGAVRGDRGSIWVCTIFR